MQCLPFSPLSVEDELYRPWFGIKPDADANLVQIGWSIFLGGSFMSEDRGGEREGLQDGDTSGLNI